jgi:pimeloyl-ACP methyl ester carboxylesterase
MEPVIRYCTTEDGVRIAYATMGDGPPLVVCPGFLGQFSSEALPGEKDYYRALAQGRRLVRYDTRGGGLSDRDVADFSLDARLRDLSAVIAALRLRRVALYAGGDIFGGQVAIAYAARYPRRREPLDPVRVIRQGGRPPQSRCGQDYRAYGS